MATARGEPHPKIDHLSTAPEQAALWLRQRYKGAAAGVIRRRIDHSLDPEVEAYYGRVLAALDDLSAGV